MTCGDWSKKTDAIYTKRLLINKQNKSYLCFRKIPDSYNRKLTSAKIRSPSPPSRSFSFTRRLFSLAVSRSLLRRSSLYTGVYFLLLSLVHSPVQGRNMVYGLRAQSPKYNWDQGSQERAQGSEEWDQGSQGF